MILNDILAVDGPISVFCHRNPDPDTIGCGLAVAHHLSNFTDHPIQVVVPRAERYSNSPMAELPGYGRFVVSAAEASTDIAVSVSVDAASLEQLGDVGHLIDRPDFMIDHHASNTWFGGINVVNADAKSCAVVVANLFDGETPITRNRDAAVCLWAGLVTDTVNFRHAGAAEFELASKLVAVVPDADKWTRTLTASHPDNWLTLLKQTLPTVEILPDSFGGHGATVMPVTFSMKKGTPNNMTHTLTAIAEQVGSTLVTVVASQIGDEGDVPVWKFSLRSKDGDTVNVSKIAQVLGGGGHVEAAGCSATGTWEDILATLEDAYAGTH